MHRYRWWQCVDLMVSQGPTHVRCQREGSPEPVETRTDARVQRQASVRRRADRHVRRVPRGCEGVRQSAQARRTHALCQFQHDCGWEGRQGSWERAAEWEGFQARLDRWVNGHAAETVNHHRWLAESSAGEETSGMCECLAIREMCFCLRMHVCM